MNLTPLYSDFQPVGCGPSEDYSQSQEWVHIDINSESNSFCLNCAAAVTSICCLDGANKLLTMLNYFLQHTDNKICSFLNQIFEEMGNFEQKTACSPDCS